MSSRTEIEAKIAATQVQLTKRVNSMTEIINKMHERMNKEAQQVQAEAVLHNKFSNSGKVNEYVWTHERAFKNHRCFVTKKLILMGTKAYKGTITYPEGDSEIEYHFMPQEMWLTKEEFTIRRIKGQI